MSVTANPLLTANSDLPAAEGKAETWWKPVIASGKDPQICLLVRLTQTTANERVAVGGGFEPEIWGFGEMALSLGPEAPREAATCDGASPLGQSLGAVLPP